MAATGTGETGENGAAADRGRHDDAAESAPLVLASGSRYRAAQLATLGLSFTSAAPGTDESARRGEPPAALAARLAAEKARAVAVTRPAAVVVGGDQVAIDAAGRRLDKPGSTSAARGTLERSSGRQATFLSAVHVVDGPGGREHAALVATRVRFRTLTASEIRRYVERDTPLDCAGAFKIESLGIALFERVASEDPSALVGLPLIATARLLRACGFRLP